MTDRQTDKGEEKQDEVTDRQTDVGEEKQDKVTDRHIDRGEEKEDKVESFRRKELRGPQRFHHINSRRFRL